VDWRCDEESLRRRASMVLILILLLLLSGGGTYWGYRSYGRYGGLVPAMLVILLIYLLIGRG
jgi:hypothetical protein